MPNTICLSLATHLYFYTTLPDTGTLPELFCAAAPHDLSSSMKSAPSHRTAVVLLIVTALLWSLGGVLIKSVPWHPLAIAGGRAACAAVVMLLSIIFLEKRRPHFHLSSAQVGGALCYAATVSLYVSEIGRAHV